MQTFIRGQKSKLADLLTDQEFLIGVDLSGPPAPIVVCFGVDQAGHLLADGWAVDAAQPSSPDGSVSYLGPAGGDEHAFRVNLDRLPANLVKLVVAVALDGQGGMRSVGAGHLRLSGSGGEAVRYPVAGADFGDEQSVILGEVYKKDIWRFAAVGQGFAGGLPALLAKVQGGHLEARLRGSAAPPAQASAPPAAAPQPPPGGYAPMPGPQPPPPAPAAPPSGDGGWAAPPPADGGWAAPPPAAYPPPTAPPAAPQPPPAAYPPPAAAATPPPAPTGGVNLGKVTLAKQGDTRTVSLRKQDGNYNPLHFNLNWSANQKSNKRRGFLSMGGGHQAPDLDLGCMFEMVDGSASVIQPLGGYFGSAHEPPWILLDKDDRTGQAADGENLWVYRPEMIRRMIVFALIYEGAPDFQAVGAYMTITDANGAETFVELNSPDANRTFAVICHVQNTGSGIEIRKEERYYTRHREADGFFQFGFDWSPGSKD